MMNMRGLQDIGYKQQQKKKNQKKNPQRVTKACDLISMGRDTPCHCMCHYLRTTSDHPCSGLRSTVKEEAS